MEVKVATYAVLVAIDIVVVVAFSVGVGATAPRWPQRWLASDPIPLRLWPWETADFFRSIGVVRLVRRLPELGTTFGGQSKSILPGSSQVNLTAYLTEVRRAEWVHWASIVSPLLLFAFNPWGLALTFVITVVVGNLPFILILRNNRRRLLAIITRGGSGA
jgi:glycosyl-4,4'-diaponeurosporenoate acyltransferase